MHGDWPENLMPHVQSTRLKNNYFYLSTHVFRALILSRTQRLLGVVIGRFVFLRLLFLVNNSFHRSFNK